MQYKLVVEDDDGTVITREFRCISLTDAYEHFDNFLRGAGFYIPYDDGEVNFETDQSWESSNLCPEVGDPKDLDWPFPSKPKYVYDETIGWRSTEADPRK